MRPRHLLYCVRVEDWIIKLSYRLNWGMVVQDLAAVYLFDQNLLRDREDWKP
jgi:hypothetical protein